MGSILPRSVQHLAHVSGNNNSELFAFEHHVKFVPIYLISLNRSSTVFSFSASSEIHRDQFPFVELIDVNSVVLNIDLNSLWSILSRWIGDHRPHLSQHNAEFALINSFLLHWSSTISFISTSSGTYRDQFPILGNNVVNFLLLKIERNSSWRICCRWIDDGESFLSEHQVKIVTIDLLWLKSSSTFLFFPQHPLKFIVINYFSLDRSSTIIFPSMSNWIDYGWFPFVELSVIECHFLHVMSYSFWWIHFHRIDREQFALLEHQVKFIAMNWLVWNRPSWIFSLSTWRRFHLDEYALAELIGVNSLLTYITWNLSPSIRFHWIDLLRFTLVSRSSGIFHNPFHFLELIVSNSLIFNAKRNLSRSIRFRSVNHRWSSLLYAVVELTVINSMECSW